MERRLFVRGKLSKQVEIPTGQLDHCLVKTYSKLHEPLNYKYFYYFPLSRSVMAIYSRIAYICYLMNTVKSLNQ